MGHYENPLVTVSMPAFNSERYLREAIQSILEQTYTNFELLILDDGSTDGTRKIIESFTDPRIIPILFEANQGLISARNEIAQRAKGKYIALMDADDKAFPSRLEAQVRFLESGKADICGGAHISLFQDTGRRKKSKERYTDSDIKALLTTYCPISNPCVMAGAEVFKRFPYLASNQHAEDYCLWIEAAMAGYSFANLKDELILYRIHSSQISVLKKNEAELISKLAKSRYLEFLGFDPKLAPTPLNFFSRLRSAIPFMLQLNQRIKGISLSANAEIYSRFQHRNNFFLKLGMRAERLLVSLCIKLLTKFKLDSTKAVL